MVQKMRRVGTVVMVGSLVLMPFVGASQTGEVSYIYSYNSKTGTFLKLDARNMRLVEQGDFTKRFDIIPERPCTEEDKTVIQSIQRRLPSESGRYSGGVICTYAVPAEDEARVYASVSPDDLQIEDVECEASCDLLRSSGLAVREKKEDARFICRGKCVRELWPSFIRYNRPAGRLYFSVDTGFGGTGTPAPRVLFMKDLRTARISRLGFSDLGVDLSPSNRYVLFGTVGLRRNLGCPPSDELAVADTNTGRVILVSEIDKTAVGRRCESVRSHQWMGNDQLKVIVEVTGESASGEVEKIFSMNENRLISRKALSK